MHFVWCVMLCCILDLCENKRRFASDLLHALLFLPHWTQQLIGDFFLYRCRTGFTISSHSHIFFLFIFFFSWNWLVRICTHAFHRFTGLFLQIFMVGGGWEIAYNKNKKEKYVSLLLIQFMWWKWGFVAQYYLFYWFLLEHEHWGGPNFYYSGYSSAIAFHRS